MMRDVARSGSSSSSSIAAVEVNCVQIHSSLQRRTVYKLMISLSPLTSNHKFALFDVYVLVGKIRMQIQ